MALDVGDHRIHDAINGHGFPMAQFKALVRLQRARERMPKVHRSQQRLLPQVRPDALEHRIHGSFDNFIGNLIVNEVPFYESSSMSLHQIKERRIMNKGGLHYFPTSRNNISSFESRQERRVHERVD